MNKIKPKVLSVFTGAGGLDLGFEAAGFDVVAAVDIMQESCETLRYNRPSIKVFGPPLHSGDIADIDAKTILKSLKLKRGDIEIMIGGPPCQSFSVAAAQRFLKTDKKFKRKGFDSERGSLVFEYLRLIIDIKPKIFVIENVPGFATIDGGKTVNNLKDVLGKHGYNVQGPFLVNAADYGVPQSRKRVIIVGTLFKKEFIFPKATHSESEYKKPLITVAQALLSIDRKSKNFETRNHKEESTYRYKKLCVGKRDPLGRVDRLNPLMPSKTIIAGGSKGGGRSHLHPFEARTLSVRECAKLQTFPDDYVFLGKIGRQFTQVGNAVPVLLAETIARSVGAQYYGKKYSKNLKYEINTQEKNRAMKNLKEKSIKNNRDIVYNDVLEDKINETNQPYTVELIPNEC